MEVHFSQEQEARLFQAAAGLGLAAEAVVTEAVESFLASDRGDIQELRAAVQEADAEIEAGQYTDYTDATLHDLFADIKRRGRISMPSGNSALGNSAKLGQPDVGPRRRAVPPDRRAAVDRARPRTTSSRGSARFQSSLT